MINEISATNETFVNEYWKKNDWVELYNCTDAEIDVAGMYLSDDESDPHKYRIGSPAGATGTVIPAFGHKIVWCDEMEPVSQLHAPFKLANDDNALVILTAQDDAWADTLVYCRHEGLTSIGRFPDGSPNVYLMPHPSIEVSNKHHCNAEYLGAASGQKTSDVEVARDGGNRIIYRNGNLLVRSEEKGPVTLSVYTLDGKLAMQRLVSLQSGDEAVNVGMLRSGLYVGRISTSAGVLCGCKFVK